MDASTKNGAGLFITSEKCCGGKKWVGRPGGKNERETMGGKKRAAKHGAKKSWDFSATT